MKAFGIGCLVVSLIFGTIGLIGIGMVVGTLNSEARLRSKGDAYEKTREAVLDTVRKVILQKTQLPAAAKADLLELLPEVIAGRQGGSSIKFVQEQYPQFTLELYQDISRSIEAERHNFLNAQENLFDVAREYNSLIRSPISGTILAMFGRNKEMDIKVISSTETKGIVESGVEDDYNLFLIPEKTKNK